MFSFVKYVAHYCDIFICKYINLIFEENLIHFSGGRLDLQ